MIFGEILTQALEVAVIEELERHAPRHTIDNMDVFEVGDIFLLAGSCDVTLHPVNYTHTDTIFPTISPSGTVTLPSTLCKYTYKTWVKAYRFISGLFLNSGF